MKINRRAFLKTGLAAIAATGLIKQLTSSLSAFEFSQMRKQSAQFTLVFASPYANSQAITTPHMHEELKENIERMSQNRIFVDIQDKGTLGIGTELMAGVSRGHIDAALISVSNLSRALPVLDIINIPYWCAKDQEYLNLIQSEVWQDLVIKPINTKSKLSILVHYLPGARCIATTKPHNKIIRVPADLDKVIFRVPASKVLKQFYQMTSANVIDVPWSDVANLSKLGRIHALDPSLVGLFSGPNNLKSHIATISNIQSVQDAWLAVISQDWLQQLPRELRLVIREAAELTFSQHLGKIKQVRTNCINGFKALGCDLYQPSQEEVNQWQEKFGYQAPDWRYTKRELLGSDTVFEQLVEATKTPN